MVETSVLVAIVLEEDGWRQAAEQIVGAAAFTTCVNIFEATLAVTREREIAPTVAYEIVSEMARRLAIGIRDYDAEAIPHAVAARERFGAGRYGLNMGDCLSYAAARRERARLLYVGRDFERTDVNDGV